MPPIVMSIIGVIQLVSSSGPVIQKLYAQAKGLFEMLFKGGLITAAQQDELMNWADKHQAAVLAGEVPPEFVVDPDPV